MPRLRGQCLTDGAILQDIEARVEGVYLEVDDLDILQLWRAGLGINKYIIAGRGIV